MCILLTVLAPISTATVKEISKSKGENVVFSSPFSFILLQQPVTESTQTIKLYTGLTFFQEHI